MVSDSYKSIFSWALWLSDVKCGSVKLSTLIFRLFQLILREHRYDAQVVLEGGAAVLRHVTRVGEVVVVEGLPVVHLVVGGFGVSSVEASETS